MSKIIKLIWDFKGEDAEQTAKHHVIHLKEFILKEQLNLNEVGTETINDIHTTAFMNVKESDVIVVRDALLPHRAEVI